MLYWLSHRYIANVTGLETSVIDVSSVLRNGGYANLCKLINLDKSGEGITGTITPVTLNYSVAR